MKIVCFAKGERGLACLRRMVLEGTDVSMVVLQPDDLLTPAFEAIANDCSAEIYVPENPNTSEALLKLGEQDADVFVLSGYGLILKQPCISLPKSLCINLHGGCLPQYRGSSPMNWSLINNEPIIGISIIQVDAGIDTGAVLTEAQMKVDLNTTIADAHEWADEQFPEMLVKVLSQIAEGTLSPRVQKDNDACYYPRRFPDDGMILWDQLTAQQVHDRVRGLTKPYPCAYTFLGNRQVRLVKSELPETPFRGEAGRIYRKVNGRLLVGASDQALWVTEAEFVDDSLPLHEGVKRYDCLATVREATTLYYRNLA